MDNMRRERKIKQSIQVINLLLLFYFELFNEYFHLKTCTLAKLDDSIDTCQNFDFLLTEFIKWRYSKYQTMCAKIKTEERVHFRDYF